MSPTLRIKLGVLVLGLVTAFTVAGARSVIASLWPVADEATARLVGAYERELALGRGPAAAMRSAQEELLRAGRAAFALDPSSPEAHWTHPYYWAPFVVFGQ